MQQKQELAEEFARFSTAIIPFLERDLTKESWNLGQWRLMETPLIFLMRNNCILDPAGNPFEWGPVFGCENPYERNDIGKYPEFDFRVDRKNPRWKELHDQPEDGMDFEQCDLVPNPESIYLNTKERNVENSLNKPRLRRILGEQLGDRFNIERDFADAGLRWRYGLACAFILHAHSDAGKEDALRLMDTMNRSTGGSGPIDESRIDIGPWEKAKEFGKILKIFDSLMDRALRSIFTNVMLSRLLTMARRRGVIPTSMFGWVRGIDRTLWYTLSQTGRACAIAEASGVFAHIAVEDALGAVFDRPIVEPAIEGLEKEMILEGWLPEPVTGEEKK